MILQSVNTTKVLSVAVATFLTKGLLSATLNKKFQLFFFLTWRTISLATEICG